MLQDDGNILCRIVLESLLDYHLTINLSIRNLIIQTSIIKTKTSSLYVKYILHIIISSVLARKGY